MIVGSTDCETKFAVSKILIHAKGKAHKLNKSVAQLRPLANYLMNRSRQNRHGGR
jgi:hypothetical protein